MVRRVAGTYVEVLRNLPPLLAIVFVNAAALATLPPIQEANTIGDVLVVSVSSSASSRWPVTGTAGRTSRCWPWPWWPRWPSAPGAAGSRPAPGRPPGPGCGAAPVVLAAAVIGYVALSAPVVLSPPGRGAERRGWRPHGLPFVAVLVGLVLYTSSHVAEIVRGSILAVPKGQTEAAAAVGLSAGQRLRHVVLPQAFRIATPRSSTSA